MQWTVATRLVFFLWAETAEKVYAFLPHVAGDEIAGSDDESFDSEESVASNTHGWLAFTLMPVRMSYIVVASLNYVITPFTLLNIYHTQYILGTSGVIVTVLSVALMIGCRPTLAYLLYRLPAEVKCA